MTVTDEVYNVLSGALGSTVEGVYDTTLPDGYVLGELPVVVFASISDVPDHDITGAIMRRVARYSVTVRAVDLGALRTVKEAVIAALSDYSGVAIGYADFESSPGEFYETDVIPFHYHTPVDFMIQF